MQLSPYEIAIIGGGFTVVGTLLGGFITFRFALALSRIEAQKNSGRRLVEAFSSELSILNPDLEIYPGEIKKILLDARHKHRSAMFEYGFYLTGNEKIRYEEKCNKYFSHVSKDGLFKKYMNENGSKLFHEEVNSLLEHLKT